MEKRPRQTGVSVGLPDEIVQIIDQDRGDVARALYLRKLIIEAITKKLNLNLTQSA